MRLAQIVEGRVVNVIEVDPENVPEWADAWPDAGAAGPGWSYDGEAFAPPEPEIGPDPKPVLTLEALQEALEAVAKAAGVSDQQLGSALEGVGLQRRTKPEIAGPGVGIGGRGDG